MTRGSRRAILLLPLAVSGCGLYAQFFGKKKPDDTAARPRAGASLRAIFQASDLVNPGGDGLPAPVLVRLYQLTAPEAFEAAPFAALFDRDAAALGGTLVGRHEQVIAPGETAAIRTAIDPDAMFIGVFVGFQKFEGAKWRAVTPMQDKREVKMTATLLRLSVDLTPE